MHPSMHRLAALTALSALLTACPGGGGGGVPDCLVFNPVHATSGGVVDVGGMTMGETREDVISLETTGIEGAPSSGVFIEVATNCDDAACTPEFTCSPGSLDSVGDTVTCDVEDTITESSCMWSCQVSLTATVLDDELCRDVFEVVEVVGQHAVPLGR